MKATLSLLVSVLAVVLLPCADLRAEEQVTVTFQGSDLTMPKSVFEAGQNAGRKMVEQFIQEQEKTQAQNPSATPTPTRSQEDNEAQMQEAAQKLFEYAKTELKYNEEDARSFVAVALVTYIQEALRHAFGQAFSPGGAPSVDQAKKQQEIVDSLKIANLYSYEDGGYLRLRGDVTNTGNAAVGSIQIEIQYLDSKGNVVDQGTAYVNGYLLPGNTGTFSTIQSLKDIAHVAYQTRVVVAYPADESAVRQKQQLLEALKIENLHSFTDGGYLRLRGDVANTGSVAVKAIQIEIQYQDAQGKTVDQGVAYVDGSGHVLPGNTGTFAVTQSTRKGLITSYKTRVVGAYPATEPDVQQKQQILEGLKIQNLSDRTQGGYMRIRGDVTNTGSIPVKSITVELQYVDAQGRVVDQGTAYVDSGAFVLPGKTGTFITTQSTRKGAVASYRARIVPSFYTQ